MTSTLGRTPVAAVVLATLLVVPDAAAETLRVPQDFDTIQQAIDAADDGDTIVVGKGEYAEHVVIDGVNDITLLGKGKPVILGDPDFDGGPTDLAFGEVALGGLEVSSSNGIFVQGFVVRGAVSVGGIVVSSSNDVTVRKCRIEGVFDDEGIGVFASNGVLIERCRIQDADGDGFNIASSSEVTITKCRVEDVGEDGVGSASSSDVLIEKSRIERCGDDGVAVSDSDGGSLTIDRLRLESCLGDGLNLSSSSVGDATTLTVDRLRLSDVDQIGVRTSGNADLTLTRSRLRTIGLDGIHAEGGAVMLEKVAITDVEQDAFFIKPLDVSEVILGLSPQGPVVITKCVALRVGDELLQLDANLAQIESLRGKDASSGIVVEDCESVSLHDVRLSQIDGLGMLLENAPFTEVSKMLVTKAEIGLEIDDESHHCTIEDVTVKSPIESGILVYGDENDLLGNVVKQAGFTGFGVFGTANTLTENVSKTSPTDLHDGAGPGANTYVDNVFGTITIDT